MKSAKTDKASLYDRGYFDGKSICGFYTNVAYRMFGMVPTHIRRHIYQYLVLDAASGKVLKTTVLDRKLRSSLLNYEREA